MAGKEEKRSNSDDIWVLDFTDETAQDFREHLLSKSEENPQVPIVVYIDSFGGQVDALAKMIATIDEVPNPIITCCMGKAMSCGAILLSHGDMRFCDPHSRIMIHRVSGVAYGDVEDIANDANEMARLNDYWLDFLAVNCSLKGGYKNLSEKIKSKDGKDRYLTATEAADFGLIDIVGLPKINALVMYEVVKAPVKMPLKKRALLRNKFIKEAYSTPIPIKTKSKPKPKKGRSK